MKKIVALVLSLVMVLGLATTAFAAPAAVELYTVDAKGEFTVIKGQFAGKTLADFVADDDMYLNAWEITNNGFFVEVPAASADYKLVYGAQVVYLTAVPEAVVKFDNEVKALTVVGELADATCGDFYDTAFDEDNDYYVAYNKKGIPTNFYVASKTGAVNVLVDGKLVKANEVFTVAQLGHTYVGFDAVNYVYTTVKCLECGKVANLYANSTAAGAKAVKMENGLGWITFADMYTYGAVAEAPATDKVESAQTFDAGIAMYVGMSVMAAAGSAVVLKKKD